MFLAWPWHLLCLDHPVSKSLRGKNMKRYSEHRKGMARRLVVSMALAAILPLSARHASRSETVVRLPQGTESVATQTDSVPMPQRSLN